MFKKLFLTIGFIAIFFCQAPLIAPKILATSDEETTFEKIWQGILDAIFPKTVTIKFDGTKESPVSTIDSKKDFTDYTKQDKDWSQRSLTQALRKKFIGIWFNEVITKQGLFSWIENTYSDEVVAEPEGDCPQIKISDIVYYYATQTDEKILYSRGSSAPIDYPSNIKHDNSIGPSSCYVNAYRGIQSIPQGIFQGKGDAALSSTQLNDQLRYMLPQGNQDKPTTAGEDAESTEQRVEDNYKHLKLLRKAILTQKASDMTNCGNDLTDEQKMDELYKNMQKNVKPQKWIKDNSADNNTNPQKYEEGIPITECSQGNGLSQYGAQGMAMKGKTYTEILTAYYGIGNDYGSGVIGLGSLESVKSATDKITVRLVQNKNSTACDALVNIYPDRFEISGDPQAFISDLSQEIANEGGLYRTFTLTVEDYLLGLGEIGLNWKLQAHQSLTIAARSFAYVRSQNLTVSISDTRAAQVFLCNRLLDNLALIEDKKTNVQIDAVNLTTGKVLTEGDKVLEAQYLRCFGGPNNNGPLFDGLVYEKLAGVEANQEYKGTCDDFVPKPQVQTTKI